jgi:hypothetical protein
MTTPAQTCPQPAHTPTPWEYVRDGKKSNYDKTPKFRIETKSRQLRIIAIIQPQISADMTGFDCEQSEANAAFIVRSCNGWNDKAALRARLLELEGGK